jgi:uncharacterized repeat protein (TIGR01451 family)
MHLPPSTLSTGSPTTPIWFRLALIAAAVIVLCSCRASGPRYRVAAEDDGLIVAASSEGPAQLIEPSAATFATDDPFDQGITAGNSITPPLPRPSAALEVQPAAYVEHAYQSADCGPTDCSPGAPCANGCNACLPSGIRGPNDEYLCDGGDFQTPAAVVTGGSVVGLEEEDAVAHYDTVDGRTIITPSNKVCIYAPRFAAVRRVVDLRAVAQIDAPEGAILDQAPIRLAETQEPGTALTLLEPNIHRVKDPPSFLQNNQHPGELERNLRVAQTLGAVAAYANLQIVHTGEIIGEDRVKIARASLAAITWTADQAAQVLIENRKAQALVSERTPGTIYLLVTPNNPKLRLVKLASKNQALPGEEVEFTLRFDNVGDRVIGNVTILDSLTTRLEYIDGSQKCSLDADFESRDNEASSLKLRWQINEPLKPGEGGVIQFRCRVR